MLQLARTLTDKAYTPVLVSVSDVHPSLMLQPLPFKFHVTAYCAMVIPWKSRGWHETRVNPLL